MPGEFNKCKEQVKRVYAAEIAVGGVVVLATLLDMLKGMLDIPEINVNPKDLLIGFLAALAVVGTVAVVYYGGSAALAALAQMAPLFIAAIILTVLLKNDCGEA